MIFFHLYDNVKHNLPKTVLKYLVINGAYNIDILYIYFRVLNDHD